MLEPELKPEFVEKMKDRQLEPTVKVDNFKKHFGFISSRLPLRYYR